MSTATHPQARPTSLHNGDRLSREEFHCLYRQLSNALYWFDLADDRELSIDADGICRIKAFPGLWIHVASLLAKDYRQLMATLDAGLATPEHAAFAETLRRSKR